MDADLQHPPEKIPDLLEALDQGNDLVVGSRYANNGGFGDFGFVRRMLSKMGDGLARTLFRPARNVHDVLSGFFAVKSSVVDDSTLNPVGFKILLEILMHGNYRNVEEIGYEFNSRRYGESKLGLNNLFNYFLHLLRLSWREGPAFIFIKFCLVGGVGSIVNLLATYFLTSSGVFYLISGLIGIEVGLLSNFFLNWVWTYRNRSVHTLPALVEALGKDHLVRSAGLLLNVCSLWLLTEFVGFYYLLSQAVGIVLGTIFNFVGNQWWTWEVESA